MKNIINGIIYKLELDKPENRKAFIIIFIRSLLNAIVFGIILYYIML